MSIINDAAEENIRQSRLYSQLADISYRAVHGKRQTTRDFTKGMLNVGKLGEQMEVPEDEITKDQYKLDPHYKALPENVRAVIDMVKKRQRHSEFYGRLKSETASEPKKT